MNNSQLYASNPLKGHAALDNGDIDHEEEIVAASEEVYSWDKIILKPLGTVR